MKRNGNLLRITALYLTRVFKVAVKTVQKCTVNDKSFNLTRCSTVWRIWGFASLLNTKRCFVGRDFTHFCVRKVSDISPWILGFSPGRLPWGVNDSGPSLLRLLSVFPCCSSFHHCSTFTCHPAIAVTIITFWSFRLGVSFHNSIYVPVLGSLQSQEVAF